MQVPAAADYARPHQTPDPRASVYTEETRILTRKQDEDRTPNLTNLDLRMRDFDAMGLDAQVISPAPPQCYYAVPPDIGIQAAKTGMLASSGIIDAVAATWRSLELAVPLVVDPVSASMHGDALLARDALDSLRTQLFPLATLVTPNLDEVRLLVDIDVVDAQSQRAAAKALHALGPRWVLVKGGHLRSSQHSCDLLYDGAEWGIPRDKAVALGYEEELEAVEKSLRAMHKRGVRVLPGGDYGFAWTPHGTNAKDLEYFVDMIGMSPMETLLSATKHGGAIMGRPNELGQVKPGYLADILLVDGDPLANIRILQDRKRILAVMKDGTFHRAPEMSAQRQRIAV